MSGLLGRYLSSRRGLNNVTQALHNIAFVSRDGNGQRARLLHDDKATVVHYTYTMQSDHKRKAKY